MGRTIIEPKVKKERKNAGKRAAKAAKEDENIVATKEEDEENESPADALRRIGIVCTHAASNKVVHRNTRDIAVSNITMTFHGQPMVDDAELTLNYGNRYGFIGRNGCGKSTFLKAIGAKCFPIPEGIDIFHLSEEIEPSEMTAMEAVMEVDEERSKLEKEAEEINDLMGEDAADDDAMERLTQVYERLDELDAASAETRAHKVHSIA
jgi:ATP-binding cassette subfamily F protein 2